MLITSLLVHYSQIGGPNSFTSLRREISRQDPWQMLTEAKNGSVADAAKKGILLSEVMNMDSDRAFSLLLLGGLSKAQYVGLGQALARNGSPTESSFWMFARLLSFAELSDSDVLLMKPNRGSGIWGQRMRKVWAVRTNQQRELQKASLQHKLAQQVRHDDVWGALDSLYAGVQPRSMVPNNNALGVVRVRQDRILTILLCARNKEQFSPVWTIDGAIRTSIGPRKGHALIEESFWFSTELLIGGYRSPGWPLGPDDSGCVDSVDEPWNNRFAELLSLPLARRL